MPTTPTAPSSSTAAVRQSRLIRAPRHAVYDAWTNPDIFAKWWGPADHVVTVQELDAREGGLLRFTDTALPHATVPPGFPRTMTGEGVYIEVVPNERVQFTCKASWNPGEASLITVSLRDADGGTEVTIHHEKLTSDHVHLYEAGWNSTLTKLSALLEA